MRDEDNGKAADLPPPAPPSEDLIAIQRRAAAQLRSDRMWQRSIAHDPALAAAVKLQEEIAFLAEMLNGRWPVSRRREQFRALRILVRRFGELGARHMINLVADVSMLDLRLILRSRTDEERHDGGRERQRLEQEIEDARLLLAVHRNRADGMCNQEAIEAAASEVLGRVTLEGAKKRMTRARRRAKERKYANPFDPFIAALLGGWVNEPEIKVRDLRGPGRPKIPTSQT